MNIYASWQIEKHQKWDETDECKYPRTVEIKTDWKREVHSDECIITYSGRSKNENGVKIILARKRAKTVKGYMTIL